MILKTNATNNNNNSENTTKIQKTLLQVRKHNDNPEEVGIVWDSATGLGIITHRWLDETAVNQDV